MLIRNKKKKQALWPLRALTLSRNNLRNAPAGPGWYLSNTYSQCCTLGGTRGGHNYQSTGLMWGHCFHSTGQEGTLVQQYGQCGDPSVIAPHTREAVLAISSGRHLHSLPDRQSTDAQHNVLWKHRVYTSHICGREDERVFPRAGRPATIRRSRSLTPHQPRSLRGSSFQHRPFSPSFLFPLSRSLYFTFHPRTHENTHTTCPNTVTTQWDEV